MMIENCFPLLKLLVIISDTTGMNDRFTHNHLSYLLEVT